MAIIGKESGSGKLITLSYATLGQEPPPADNSVGYWASALAAMLFTLCFTLCVIVLNAGTLLFGVVVEWPWRRDAGFRLLFLPGGIPVIAVAAPVLGLYALWRSWLVHGLLLTAAPFIVTTAAGCLVFAGFVLINRLRRRSAGKSR